MNHQYPFKWRLFEAEIILLYTHWYALQETFTALGFEAMSYQLNASFFFLQEYCYDENPPRYRHWRRHG